MAQAFGGPGSLPLAIVAGVEWRFAGLRRNLYRLSRTHLSQPALRHQPAYGRISDRALRRPAAGPRGSTGSRHAGPGRLRGISHGIRHCHPAAVNLWIEHSPPDLIYTFFIPILNHGRNSRAGAICATIQAASSTL